MSYRQECVTGLLCVDEKMGQRRGKGLVDLRCEASRIERPEGGGQDTEARTWGFVLRAALACGRLAEAGLFTDESSDEEMCAQKKGHWWDSDELTDPARSGDFVPSRDSRGAASL